MFGLSAAYERLKNGETAITVVTVHYHQVFFPHKTSWNPEMKFKQFIQSVLPVSIQFEYEDGGRISVKLMELSWLILCFSPSGWFHPPATTFWSGTWPLAATMISACWLCSTMSSRRWLPRVLWAASPSPQTRSSASAKNCTATSWAAPWSSSSGGSSWPPCWFLSSSWWYDTKFTATRGRAMGRQPLRRPQRGRRATDKEVAGRCKSSLALPPKCPRARTTKLWCRPGPCRLATPWETRWHWWRRRAVEGAYWQGLTPWPMRSCSRPPRPASAPGSPSRWKADRHLSPKSPRPPRNWQVVERRVSQRGVDIGGGQRQSKEGRKKNIWQTKSVERERGFRKKTNIKRQEEKEIDNVQLKVWNWAGQ